MAQLAVVPGRLVVSLCCGTTRRMSYRERRVMGVFASANAGLKLRHQSAYCEAPLRIPPSAWSPCYK